MQMICVYSGLKISDVFSNNILRNLETFDQRKT